MKPYFLRTHLSFFQGNNFFFRLCIVILCANTLFAQPRIEIQGGTKFNLGVFNEGEEIIREFVVKNVGADTLVIDDVSTSCGCAVAEESASRIAPRDSARITITIDTNELSGAVKKEIYIASNDELHDEMTITLLATIKPVVDVEPRYLTLTNAKVGTTLTKKVILTNKTNAPITVTEISVPDTDLTVELQQKTLRPGIPVEMVVKFLPTSERKYLGQIVLKTNSPRKKEIRISYIKAQKQ